MTRRDDGARRSRDSGDGRDSVGMYLDEIARTPLLDAAQEVELSKTIEAGLLAEQLLAEGRIGRRKGGAPAQATKEELEGLAAEGQAAQQRFVSANLRLVVSIARKYGRNQMPMLDLVQEGNTGLIRAVEKFDYAKGYKFSTYATWWVRQAITRGIAQQARVVRLPVHVVEELNQGGAARRHLERVLGAAQAPADAGGGRRGCAAPGGGVGRAPPRGRPPPQPRAGPRARSGTCRDLGRARHGRRAGHGPHGLG